MCDDASITVTAATLAVLKVASLKPGAILNDAYKEYLVSTNIPYSILTSKLYIMQCACMLYDVM